MAGSPYLLATLLLVPAQEQLKDNLKKKLGEAWVTKAAWVTDYDRAKAESKKSGKPIFAYFTRSYAY
jgi:hypothetical protein